jgi:glycosyltransferase involved in cell wall biosynthesis
MRLRTQVPGAPDDHEETVETKSLKILFLSMEYPPETGGGGIGSYVACIGQALAARGHEVHVLSCFRNQPRRDYQDGGVWIHRRSQFRVRGVGRFGAPDLADRVDAAISAFLEYRRLGLRFNVIEAPDWMAEGLVLGLLGVSPLVGHIHTPLSLIRGYGGGQLGRQGQLADALERLSIRRAHVVTAPSELILRLLKERAWLNADQARVISYPIDLPGWNGVPLPDKTDPIVLSVGRLESRKAPEVLVQAAARLANDVPDLEIVFVGRSSTREGRPYREWLRDMGRDLGVRCRFIDQVPRNDLSRWYASARVVALPSRFDNFPMAALEAFASGRPLVCTSTTGTADIVREGSLGAVVPPDDPDSLAAGLLPYLADAIEASRVGSRAREFVRDHCDPDLIAAQREACYRDAIRDWRGPRVRLGPWRHPAPATSLLQRRTGRV